MSDEIMEEVWRIKDKIAARYNYDVRALAQDLRKKQKQSGRKVVTLPPKKVPVAK